MGGGGYPLVGYGPGTSLTERTGTVYPFLSFHYCAPKEVNYLQTFTVRQTFISGPKTRTWVPGVQ
jgi:hypothetical protein